MNPTTDPMILLWTLVKIIVIAVPVILAVAMYVWWERKVIGWMHVRMGPNKIGPWGLLQAFADVTKLLIKEVIIPTNANRFLYFTAPLLSVIPALAVWAIVPFDNGVVLSNANAGVLFLLAKPGFPWLGLKISAFMFFYFWLRATFPRYRYDQIMRLGWKVFIPLSIAWIFVAGVLRYFNIVTVGH